MFYLLSIEELLRLQQVGSPMAQGNQFFVAGSCFLRTTCPISQVQN